MQYFGEFIGWSYSWERGINPGIVYKLASGVSQWLSRPKLHLFPTAHHLTTPTEAHQHQIQSYKYIQIQYKYKYKNNTTTNEPPCHSTPPHHSTAQMHKCIVQHLLKTTLHFTTVLTLHTKTALHLSTGVTSFLLVSKCQKEINFRLCPAIMIAPLLWPLCIILCRGQHFWCQFPLEWWWPDKGN